MDLVHQYGSLGVPQTPKSCDALIEVFKFIRYVLKKLHVCTYSSVQFTLRFVNLFVEVSRVCDTSFEYDTILRLVDDAI